MPKVSDGGFECHLDLDSLSQSGTNKSTNGTGGAKPIP